MSLARAADTIAAIATPPGVGGIGIIRISGSAAHSILKTVFSPRKSTSLFDSHKLYYGDIVEPTGTVIDEIMAVYMKGPATYTTEDVVELQCHGSYILLQKILQLVFSNGARPAEPGEFTKRAFLGGRIDLIQAEAVIDLLHAQTDKGLNLAVGQLQGLLTDVLGGVRDVLVEILAVLEVAIDFPDDDVELLDHEQMKIKLKQHIIKPLDKLINAAAQGKIIREGVNVVLAGRPNVGKSSLLNALLREDRALVASTPGTTRDTIEETVSIHGIPVHLVDTAGIRAHKDIVEELGMERALQKMDTADVILFLVDASAGLSDKDYELYELLKHQKHIVILNKKDTCSHAQLNAIKEAFSRSPYIAIAAKQAIGINELQELLFQVIVEQKQELYEGASCAPNTRHLSILNKTMEAAQRLLIAVEQYESTDLLAVETQVALDHLSDIVGITTPEDVLDAIFNDFCIGK